MQIRSVIKLGVVLSVVLFCIGIAFYGFARLSMADKENRVDIFEFVPKTVRAFLKRITLIILCMSFRRLHILPSWTRFIVRA